jgi:NADH-quinone oxidoreductase subunit L
MFLAMGVGAFGAGIFHLYTHAFFKALLFLGSGAVIHALAGEQDLRKMGGLKSALPITYWTFLIGAIAIAGVPGLAGFFSKDEILFRTFESGHTILWAIGLITSLLTAIYMFRLVFMAFHGRRHAAAGHTTAPVTHGGHGHGGHLHDAPPAMALALIVLAAGSVLAGYVGVPAALGGANRLEHFLEPSFGVHHEAQVVVGDAPVAAEGEHASEQLELALMALSSLVAVAGIGIAFYFFLKNPRASDDMAERFAGARRVLANKYYVDEAYDAAIVQPIRVVSQEGLWKGIDVRVIDGAVNGVGAIVAGLGDGLRRLQTGSVRAYAASLFLGVVLVLGYYLWR